MTQNGVRSGGSPRDPKPGESSVPDTTAGAARQAPSDWLAPAAPPVAAPPSRDWLAPPAPVARPAAPAEEPFAEDEPLAEEEPYIGDLFEDEELLEDDELLEEDEGPEEAAPPHVPLSERLKRMPPALVFLTLAAIGSTGFLAFELSTRTAPIAVLSSASVVVGLCYVAITVVCAIATYRVASEGRSRLAFLLAFIGGSAAIVAAMSFAGALVLVLALGF